MHIQKILFYQFLFKFKQKNINKIFIKNVIRYQKYNYVIFDKVYYTDYIYQIIIKDIYFLYYYKKHSNKCYLII
jgi:hypothetical protein